MDSGYKYVADDFVHYTWRSDYFNNSSSGSPPAVQLLPYTASPDHYGGSLHLRSNATGASLREVSSTTSGFTVANQVSFYARCKMPAYSASEKDLFDFGLQDSSSFNAYLQFIIYYAESPQNFFIYSRANSGTSEVGYNIGIALPGGGGSTDWFEVLIETFGTGNNAYWELTYDTAVQASGIISSGDLPTLSLRPYFRVGKPVTGGSRQTEGYIDKFFCAHKST